MKTCKLFKSLHVFYCISIIEMIKLIQENRDVFYGKRKV